MSKQKDTVIVKNKTASRNFILSDSYQAGIVLEGWEVKSLRQGQVTMRDSFIMIDNNEGWIHNLNISPLISKSSHYESSPTRIRKLLLNNNEIKKIKTHIEQKGFTCVCTSLYWKKHLVKCNLALAKGKTDLDKRNILKERAWNIEKQRVLKKKF